MKIKLLISNKFIKNNTLKDLFRVMRVTLILLFVLSFQLIANNVNGQDAVVKLKSNKISVRQLISEIENQTDYLVVYSNREVNTSREVNLKNKSDKVSEYLNQTFHGTDIGYDFENNYIILAKKDSENKTLEILSAKTTQQTGKTVTGKVVDVNGEPIIGATIVVQGDATKGTVTDVDGNYVLTNIPENAVLDITYVGMQSQSIPTSGRTSVNVTLLEDMELLDEVVVVGYGTMKKVNLTGSVSSINSKKLENRPITNSTQTLQGVSGVYVNQAGGQPGRDAATIRIRGQGTLNNNNPLIIVDGIEQSLSDVNPNDIESISVLKDAASASIYGNRAASGVILVSTKRGAEGDFKFEYGNYFGVQSATYLPKLINDPVEYMELRNQAQRNAGRKVVDFSDETIEEYKQGRLKDPYTYPENNWIDIMFNNAFIQEHNLRVSGGRRGLSSSLSIGYTDQKGILMNTNSSKLSLRSNINYQIKDNFKIGSDIAIMYRFIHQSAASVGGGESLLQNIWKMKGYDATYLEDGRYADTWVVTPGHNVNRHPLVWANEGFNDAKTC